MSASKSLSAFAPACARLAFKALCAFAFVFLFLFASSALSESILTVQHNNGYNASATSVAVAFSSNVTSGNLILVAESSSDGVSLETPTDTLGNPFVQLVTKGTSGQSVAAVYAATANASGADTVTCGISAANNIHCHIYELQGVTATIDETGNSSQTSTSLSVSTTSATTNAVDYVFAYFSDNNNESFYTAGPGFGNTEASEDAAALGGDSAFSEDAVVLATGIQTATATSSLADTYVNVIVALVTSGTPLAATPVFSPSGGSFIAGQSVSISDATPGASIYYTTDGTTPTTDSAAYAGAITVPASETLEALATAPSFSQSLVGSATFTIGAFSGPIETVQHNSGGNPSATSVAVSYHTNITSGNLLLVAESSYDGVTFLAPTDTLGNTFTQLALDASGAGGSGAAIYGATANASGADTVTCHISATNNIHCHIYEVEGVKATVDKTGTSAVSGTALTVSTAGATSNNVDYLFAFFTNNGSESNYTPGTGWGDTETSNNTSGDSAYSEDEVVLTTGIQTATATASASNSYDNLIVALQTSGTPAIPTPAINPSGGTYISVQTVNISDSYPSAVIYFTTDGTTPATSSPVYTSALTVSTTQTLQAIAVGAGYANSQTAVAVYNINLPTDTPTFSPVAGTYGSAQSVTISDGTPGATIYYTTNGFTPSTSSAVYSAPITVASWETVEAIAIAPGDSQSLVGVAPYTIGNPAAAAPSFSPGAGTYGSTQTVTLSDATAGATIYYTVDGSAPTTGSAVYISPITVFASETVNAIAIAGGYAQSGVGVAAYTITNTAGSCADMSVGRSVDGTANMNGFVPFQNATNGLVSMWNTNIANAAVDPNNASIQTTPGYSGLNTHINFGSSPGDGGIPFMIIDSGQTPSVPINVIDYASEGDVVVAPYPNNVPIEGNEADCTGWPDNYPVYNDSHTNVIDRNGCWDYETYYTNHCNGLYNAAGEAIWDLQNGNQRPWGWTSTDAGGLSVMAGLMKYDEAASGHINHAVRYTMQQAKNDVNNGYFVEPASHAAGGSFSAPTPEGMRVRLKASFNISGFSAINQTILTALQQYGMIMADNGGYFFIQGATDPRWNDADLTHLAGISSSNFEVIATTPAYPGWDSVTAPTGTSPVINSFTASPQTVSAGSPVTFNYSVSGDSYDYIDMIGPVRLTQNGGGPGVNTGSVTIYPTATQTYTLYSVNQYGNNGSGAGYGVTPSTPITIEVPGSVVAPPTFTPPPGPYVSAKTVTFNTTTYPFASFYYTTDGSTPTYPISGTTIEYPQIPQPMSPQSQGHVESITVAANETINAIAVVEGYSSPSAVSTGVYLIGPITATPTFSPVPGSFGSTQTVTISDTTAGNTIYYTTDGSTPSTGSTVYSAPLTVSSTETLQAIAASAGNNNSVVATGIYTIGGTAATPTFAPVAGTYAGNQNVSINDTSTGSSIYYTVTAGTTGTTPTSNSTHYSGAFTVSTTSVVEAIATGGGYTSSAPGTATYTITAAAPGFSPSSGNFASAQTVTITDASAGATIYYTLTAGSIGTTPTTSSSVYSSPIPVPTNSVVEAIAAGGGYAPSVVSAATYNIAAAVPTFSPVAGNYLNPQTVSISDTTSGAVIYYTTDGSTPTTGSTVYSAAISVSASQTLKAIATAPGDSTSAAASAPYVIGVAVPTLSPAGGSYTSIQVVTISDTSPGALIYYTTNGTTPNSTSSTLYSGPITVAAPMTITALGTEAGYNQSATTSATYTYTTPTPAAIYVQQCTGYQQYGNSVSCTFTSPSTAGDTILISAIQTTSGDTITSVTSNIGTPTLVTSNSGSGNTLYAYALTNIGSGTYTITANASSGTSRMWLAADEFTDVPTSPIDVSANGYNPGNYVSSVVSGNFNTTQGSDMLWAVCFANAYMNAGNAPIPWTLLPQDTLGSGGNMTLEDGVAGAAGTYYGQCTSGGVPGPQIVTVALLGTPPAASAPVFSPAAGTYTSPQSVTISSTVPSASYYYTTDGTTPTTSSNLYSGPVSVASSQTLKAITVAAAYSNSAANSAAYTINLPPAATPGFSPAAGNYATSQTVTISDSATSPSIYYTTDGTTPTTGSTLYTAPITVSATTETVQAVAIAPGFAVSATATAVYTIGNPVATPVLSPGTGTYTTIQTVSISDSTPSSTIYYTTNGSTPTTTSPVYSGAITVSATETINAIATASGYVQSNLASAIYTINLPTAVTPFFSPYAGTYAAAQSVVIATTTPSASIYYTTNGTAPTTGSTLYSSAVSVSTTSTLEAIAVATGYNNSAVGSSAYTISASGGSAPTFAQSCNNYINYTGAISCTLSSVGAGHALVIGIDATSPYLSSVTYRIGSGSNVTIPMAVVSNTAYGALYGYVLPNATAGNYTITANFSPATVKVGLLVTEYSNINISPVDTSASGSSASYGSYAKTTNFTTVGANELLWAMCYGPGGTTLGVGNAPITWTARTTDGSSPSGSGVTIFAEDGPTTTAGTYYGDCSDAASQTNIIAMALIGASTPTVATPTFSPGSETYTSAQTVTISDTTAGASVYYTTDGTVPSSSTSTLYTTPITVSANETLEAKAYLTGDTASPVGYATYIINLTAAATPVFSPAAGSFTTVQTVTISDSTTGNTIYYTTNGTMPTTGSSVYSTPITVSTTQTLEAIAVATGYSNSAAQTGVYSIVLPATTPVFSPVGGSYSTVQVVTISDSTPSSTIYYTINGTTPTTASPVYSGPITVPAPETLEAVAIASGYRLSSTGSAAYSYPAPSGGASYVQQCSNYSPSGASGGHATCTLTGVTAGDTLVIGVQNSAATINSFTSSTTAQPTLEISNLADTNASLYLSAAILPNAPSGSITITASNASTYTAIWLSVTEYTNVAASPYDTSADKVLSGGYGGASIATPSFTTAASGDMLWTMCAGLGGGYANFFAGTIPITWTAVNSNGSPVTTFVEDGSAGAAGSYTGQCQSNATSPNGGGVDDAAIMTLALKASGATATTPVFSPVAGSYTQAQSVTISTSTPSATIYYTTDGATPTTASTTYTIPISVAAWETVKAIAVSTGYANSPVGSAAYSIGVATPALSPAGGTYTSIQTVTISDATGGATIYYTTNGTTPTTSSPIYSTPITVSMSQTLEALGVLSGSANSAVAPAAYVINLTAAMPAFSPAAGTFNSAQTVTISDATGGATIYYTTNGFTPTTSSPTYSAPISVSATETLEALATYAGDANSAVASAIYNLQVATPAFSPAAGSYSTDQSVTISDSTGGATIYYTTNGSTPTTGSAIYSGPVPVTTAQTLEAIGVLTGYSNSTTASAAYTFPPPTSSPSYVQQCTGIQTYGTADSCTLTGVTAGDAIVVGVYTSNALVSVTSSTTAQPVSVVSNTGAGNLYAYLLPNTASGSITITANQTSSAKMWLTVTEYANVAASPIDAGASGSNTVYGNNVSSTSYTTTAASDMLWSLCYGPGGGTMTAGTTPIAWTALALAPQGSPDYYADIFVEDGVAGAAGTYFGQCNNVGASSANIVSLALLSAGSPAAATPTFSPAAGSYELPQTVTISTTTPSSTIYYTTDGTIPTTNSPAYSSPISVAAYETVEAISVSAGYSNSAVGSAAYSIGVAMPAFSLVSGSYTGAQSVTISDATGGAAIYYTTNGAAPTTNSTLYSGAISVSTSETLEAIGAEAGYSSSAVASAAFAIQAVAPSFSPAAGTYTTIQTVTISTTTPSATIYYTTDGNTPTTNSTVYSSAIAVSTTETLSAITAATGDTASAVGSALYTINLPTASTPGFSPAAGTYTGTQSVSISDATANSTIYYTTNGSTPTTSSAQYSAAISVSANETLEAIATANNYLTSATGSAAYTIVPATPVFSLAAGSYYGSQTVTISDATAGASIYYTTNATTPTTNSATYTAPLAITATQTVEAIAASSGAPASSVASAIYTIATPAALTVPTPDTSTPLSGTSVAFAWTAGNTATHFEFYVGTTGVGSSNLYNSGNVTATTETVTGLPNNGEALYARLYYLINGAWRSTDYTYVANGAPTQAVLTTPAPNTSTPLAGTSVAFAWSPGNLATHFEFFVGTTGAGSSNLYNSGNVTATTATVSGLPSNGETVNVRLYSLINGAWQSTDYTYVASGSPIAAALTTPAPNTTTPLSGTSVAFSWTPGNVATHFEFYVGTTGVGSSNLYNSGNVTATTETVSDLPTNDSTVYVRLYSLINGAWQSTDYTYISTGTATQAVLTTPAPNTTTPLSGTSVTFSWNPGNSATHFEFYVGSTGVGSNNLYSSGNVTATTETVSDLPSNGQTVYVRLYSLLNGAWQYTDYTYVANGAPVAASLTAPVPNTSTPLSGTSVTFSWTPGNLATHFEFYAGTTGVGSSNLYNSGNVTATSETVSNLPSNGETLYVRLYSLINGAWQYTDYTYVANGAPVAAALTAPTPNTPAPLSGTSVAFSWTPGNIATHFEFYAGTTGAGSSNLYNSGNVTATSETVSDLPSNGETVYVRLYSLINGAWQYTDYTYVASGAPTQAALTEPPLNSQFTSTTETFTWSPGNTATHFILYLGTSAGSSNLYNSGNVTATTETVSGLPSNGETVYARLYSLINGAWQYASYTYTAF